MKKKFSNRTRARWLKRRHWPFQISVITNGDWRVSAGIYDTFGEGRTLQEAVDDAILNERLRKKGCCLASPAVIVEVNEAKARQMLRACDALKKALTGNNAKYRICP